MGDRTVAREDYAAVLSRLRQARPDLRIIVYDHSFHGDRAWFRFTMRWTDLESRELRTRAGLQSYRTEAGQLAETWVVLQPVGSARPAARVPGPCGPSGLSARASRTVR